MSDNQLRTVVGTTGYAWAYQFRTADGGKADLTAATGATFSMTKRGATSRTVSDKAAIIADGTYTLADGSVVTLTKADGVVLYQPVAGDVADDGIFDGQYVITMPAGPVVGPPPGDMEIVIAKAI